VKPTDIQVKKANMEYEELYKVALERRFKFLEDMDLFNGPTMTVLTPL
jgi:hypothetical protein